MILDYLLLLGVALAVTLPTGLALIAFAFRERLSSLNALLAVPLGLAAWVLVLQAVRTVGLNQALAASAILAVAGVGATTALGAWRYLRALLPTLGVYVASYLFLLMPLWLQAQRHAILGYGRNEDSIFNLVMAQRIVDGLSLTPPSSVTQWQHYPLGSFDLIAVGAQVVSATAFESYMPMLALATAALIFPAAWLIEMLELADGWKAAAIGVLITLGYLQVDYFVQASAPSTMMLPLLLTGMCLSWSIGRASATGPAAAAGICIGAAVGVYSFSPLLWFAPFMLLALGLYASQHGANAASKLAISLLGLGSGLVLALPGIVRAAQFYLETKSEFTGVVLGNLGRSLTPLLALGVERGVTAWLTVPGLLVAGVLFFIGLVWALARQRTVILVLLFSCGFATIYTTLAGPYWVAKTFAVAAVPTVALTVAGAKSVIGLRSHRASVAAAAGLVVSVWLAAAAYTSTWGLLGSRKTPSELSDLGRLERAAMSAGRTLIVAKGGQTWAAWFLRRADPTLVVVAEPAVLGGEHLDAYDAVVLQGSGTRLPRNFVRRDGAAGFVLYVRRAPGLARGGFTVDDGYGDSASIPSDGHGATRALE